MLVLVEASKDGACGSRCLVGHIDMYLAPLKHVNPHATLLAILA